MYETLLNKYGVRQLGYYVEDIDTTANQMAKLFGAGPFIDTGESSPEVCIFRGKESDLTTRVAMGQFADLQIELIQVTSEGENVYSEMSHYGLHHLCIWSDDVEKSIQEFLDAGFDLAMRLTSVGIEVAYFDCRDSLGCYIEIAAPQEDLYEGIAGMTEDWDGKEAVMGLF